MWLYKACVPLWGVGVHTCIAETTWFLQPLTTRSETSWSRSVCLLQHSWDLDTQQKHLLSMEIHRTRKGGAGSCYLFLSAFLLLKRALGQHMDNNVCNLCNLEALYTLKGGGGGREERSSKDAFPPHLGFYFLLFDTKFISCCILYHPIFYVLWGFWHRTVLWASSRERDSPPFDIR